MQTLIKILFPILSLALLAACAVIGDVRYYLTYKDNIGVRYGLKFYKLVPGIAGTVWALMLGAYEVLTGMPVLNFVEKSTNDNWVLGIMIFYIVSLVIIIVLFFALCSAAMKLFASATLGRLVEQRQNNLADKSLRDEVMEMEICREMRDLDKKFIAQGLYESGKTK